MSLVEGTVFSGGPVQIAGGEVKVAQHAVAGRIVRQITLHLLQELFRLSSLALSHVKASERSPGVGIPRIYFNGAPELLFGFREAAARLVIAAERELRVHRLGIQFDRLFEVGLGGVRLGDS